MPAEFVTVGRIISAFGIKGWVELVSYTEPESNLFQFMPWHLAFEHKPVFLLINHVLSYKTHKQKTNHHSWVAQFAACQDRDQALALRGAYIQVPRDALPALAENEYYWSDLEGLAVYTLQDQLLGQVDYLFATGSNDVLVVKNGDKTVYIPYVCPEVVQKIDLEQKRILVDWE